ncbi:MAG: sensor histidine kinase [Actinomycetota bacterium]|nr:sensor histidine kinase [Actinomycetota bacterium]
MTVQRQATRAISLATGLVVCAGIAAVVVGGQTWDRAYVGIVACTAVSTIVLASVVSQRRPANLVAPVMAWMGLLIATVAFSDTYLPANARRPDVLPPLPAVASAILVVTWVWLYVAVALLLLVFPDGRVPGPRWRWVAVALLGVGVAIQFVMAVSPGPYDAPYTAVAHPFGDLPTGPVTVLRIILFPALCLLVLACAASLCGRYRRGNAVRRAQLKWLALASLVLPATVLLSWVGFLVLGTHSLAGIGFVVLYVAVPVSTTIAIVRHDLYDVDRALSLAVFYGVTSAAVAGLFALASFVTGALLGHESVVVAAGVTAATSLAGAPLRRRLKRAVDRRVYPLRREALGAVESLGNAIAAGRSDPEQLQDVLRTALRDPALRVGILDGGHGFLDPLGTPTDLGADPVPVLLRGVQVGAISSSGPATPRLMREVAAASAMLVEMARLRLELSTALRDAAASRTRLQQSGYDERRRLERDLHDGAQQRLVSLGMALRLAQRHLGDATVDVDGLLDESVAQLATAVAELREIAHGLRPSCLDEGLHPALSAIAARATLPIDLQLEAGDSVPDDIATTTYFVVSEAVTNAVKHAEASRIGLRVVREGEHLLVSIRDNGCGGAAIRPGAGLAGLSDRVAAAGGSLSLHSAPRQGTVVEVVLPCAS